jgi:hypothetical protein
MKLADYPPQEPLSEAGQAYSAECWRRSDGIACREVDLSIRNTLVGDDPA